VSSVKTSPTAEVSESAPSRPKSTYLKSRSDLVNCARSASLLSRIEVESVSIKLDKRGGFRLKMKRNSPRRPTLVGTAQKKIPQNETLGALLVQVYGDNSGSRSAPQEKAASAVAPSKRLVAQVSSRNHVQEASKFSSITLAVTNSLLMPRSHDRVPWPR
jgi:hypothetical protein